MTDLVRGLKCRLCGKAYPKQPINYCEDDFGPLEVDYDYAAISHAMSRSTRRCRETAGRLTSNCAAISPALRSRSARSSTMRRLV